MPYLIASDLKKQIQSANLDQIIGSDNTILAAAELTAMDEAKSYLVQKYDITQEFANLNQWDNTIVYKGSNRVYLNAAPYNALSTYALGTTVLQANNIYRCTTAILTPEVFNPSKWFFIGLQYAIFYAQYPFPVFSYDKQYLLGDKVFWKDNVYTNLVASSPLSKALALQYAQYQNLPLLNFAPDNINNGIQVWGVGTPYTVPVSTDILNTTFWTLGDNRSQQLVTYIVDIALYHVHSRISPRNIPELRVYRYKQAADWLKASARGEVTAALPLLLPAQGGRIRYGGNIKQTNSY